MRKKVIEQVREKYIYLVFYGNKKHKRDKTYWERKQGK